VGIDSLAGLLVPISTRIWQSHPLIQRATVHLWVLYDCVLSQVAMGPLLDATMWDLEIQGKTAVCVALDGSIRGVLGLADTAKPEAYSTIRALQEMHMDVWMVRMIALRTVTSTGASRTPA
jgi:high-affinity K+ transport system ATPase subunit B